MYSPYANAYRILLQAENIHPSSPKSNAHSVVPLLNHKPCLHPASGTEGRLRADCSTGRIGSAKPYPVGLGGKAFNRFCPTRSKRALHEIYPNRIPSTQLEENATNWTEHTVSILSIFPCIPCIPWFIQRESSGSRIAYRFGVIHRAISHESFCLIIPVAGRGRAFNGRIIFRRVGILKFSATQFFCLHPLPRSRVGPHLLFWIFQTPDWRARVRPSQSLLCSGLRRSVALQQHGIPRRAAGREARR